MRASALTHGKVAKVNVPLMSSPLTFAGRWRPLTVPPPIPWVVGIGYFHLMGLPVSIDATRSLLMYSAVQYFPS